MYIVLKSFFAMSAEDFDTPLKTAIKWKALLSLISVPLPFFWGEGGPALDLSHEIFPLFCVLFVYLAVWMQDNFYRSFGDVFTWHFIKVCRWTLLFNRMCSSRALPWLLTLDWAPISHSTAHEMRIILCDLPVNTDTYFSLLSGHRS